MIFLDFFGLFVWLSLANYHFSTQSNRKKNDGHIFLIFSVMFYSNDLSFIYIYIYAHYSNEHLRCNKNEWINKKKSY